MASYFNLTLDTTAPSGASISLPAFTGSLNITASLAAVDAAQMKLWGDITAAATEDAAAWETFATEKSLILTSGDGAKTVYVKFRDNVGNETAAKSAIINLDTAAPVVTITGPDVSTISTVAGFDACEFSFVADQDFVEYMVAVVPASDSAHTAGTVIQTTGGSENMSGTGEFAAASAINCKIKGADLLAASSGDGAKIIKVFVKDAASNWSV